MKKYDLTRVQYFIYQLVEWKRLDHVQLKKDRGLNEIVKKKFMYNDHWVDIKKRK